MSNLFIEPVKLADKYKLTNLTDPSIIPQLIKGPAQSVVEQIEGDVTKYIQTTLVSLNIDQDILERQTAEIYRLNRLLNDLKSDVYAALTLIKNTCNTYNDCKHCPIYSREGCIIFLSEPDRWDLGGDE